jgi:hypothetical protein
MPDLKSFHANLAKRMGYAAVYFVTLKGEKDGPCKVGVSTKPITRLTGLQVSSPFDLEFSDIIFVRCDPDAVDQAWLKRSNHLAIEDFAKDMYRISEDIRLNGIDLYRVERELHQEFKAAGMHLRGEWFSGGASMLVSIARAYIKKKYPGRDYLDMRSMLRKIRLMQDEARLAG